MSENVNEKEIKKQGEENSNDKSNVPSNKKEDINDTLKNFGVSAKSFFQNVSDKTKDMSYSLEKMGFEIGFRNLKGLINLGFIINAITVVFMFLPLISLYYYRRPVSIAGTVIEFGRESPGFSGLFFFLLALKFILLFLLKLKMGRKPALAMVYNIVYDGFFMIMLFSIFTGTVDFPITFFGYLFFLVLGFNIFISSKILKEQVVENYINGSY